MKSYSAEILITPLFYPSFISLVFIDNHTIKYDIKKHTKYHFCWLKSWK